MPSFNCKKCGCVNLVPPENTHFTCNVCGAEQSTPAFSDSVEDSSLDNMVLAPEGKKQINTDSFFNRFDSIENETESSRYDKAASKEGIYCTALSKMGGENPKLYQEALGMLQSLKGYKDADKLAEECRQKIEQLEAEKNERTQKAAKRQKNRKLLLAIGIPVMVFAAAAILFMIFIFVPQRRYNSAMRAEKSGDIVTAYELYNDLNGYQDSKEKAASLFERYKTEKIKTAMVGDTVYFGAYEQDADTKNGAEDIEWRVIDETDDAVLLFSVYGLDCQQYHKVNEPVTWETSSIRKWLNNDFLNAAFSEEQQTNILTADVPSDDNPDHDTDPGNDTRDKVFLLSIDEAERYLKSEEECRCVPTNYAISRGVERATKKHANGRAGTWFLRTPGLDETMAAYVSSAGKIRHMGYSVASMYVATRPAIWVKK